MHETITLILGGGRGTRLFPLTRVRSKPAVPLGGKYRLVDVPISNALHAGLDRIYVLTQFNSASLHRHIRSTYSLGHLSGGFVEILAASQSLGPSTDWYEGTADAVRKVLERLDDYAARRVLILSGDQLYRLDFQEVLRQHVEHGAEVTVAGNLIPRDGFGDLGIMRIDPEGRIRGFVEKPDTIDELTGFEVPAGLYPEGSAAEEKPWAASMGIYVWELEVLREALATRPEATDFGHEIIPAAIESRIVSAYLFDGYWEDIGTIGNFFEANLALTGPDPPFEFRHQGRLIYTHPRYLPPVRVRRGMVQDALLADGCDLDDCTVERSVIGIRSIIGPGCVIRESVLMGADFYPSDRPGDPPIGVGEGSRIERAIVDKNARIGRNVVLRGRPGAPDRDGEDHYVRDGIIVIPKDAVIPEASEIIA